jgi:hypothetical protein
MGKRIVLLKKLKQKVTSAKGDDVIDTIAWSNCGLIGIDKSERKEKIEILGKLGLHPQPTSR